MSSFLSSVTQYSVLAQKQPVTARLAEHTATVGAHVGVSFEIKRSEFITYLKRVESEDEARAFVENTRKVHYDARHHCSAFIIGAERNIQRSNDDGEPAGTAGIPMLDALRKRETQNGETDLSDICAVVVRYFGGIKLGAGGLVRAYSEAVSHGLESSVIHSRNLVLTYGLAAPYEYSGRWENELRAAGYSVSGTEYQATDAIISFGVSSTQGAVERMTALIAQLTSGTRVAERIGQHWIDHG